MFRVVSREVSRTTLLVPCYLLFIIGDVLPVGNIVILVRFSWNRRAFLPRAHFGQLSSKILILDLEQLHSPKQVTVLAAFFLILAFLDSLYLTIKSLQVDI